MATVRLRVNDSILDQVLLLLNQFDEDELEVLKEDNEFLQQRKYLHEQAARLERGEAKTFSIEEVDDYLEDTIRKYEG